MSAVGRDGLHAHPAMELSTPSRRNDRQIRITDSRAQCGLDSYRIDGDIVQSCHTCGLEITEREIFFLQWNISDYFYQNRDVLRLSLNEEKNKVFPEFPGVPNMAAFDKLWMCLYTKLGTLAGFCPLIPKCNKWFCC